MYSNGLPILDGVEPKIKNDGLCIMIEWTFRLILWKNSQIFLKFKCIILSEFIPNQVLVLLFHFFQINYCILVIILVIIFKEVHMIHKSVKNKQKKTHSQTSMLHF